MANERPCVLCGTVFTPKATKPRRQCNPCLVRLAVERKRSHARGDFVSRQRKANYCKFPNCDRRVEARGLCRLHDDRMRRDPNGDHSAPAKSYARDNFWANTAKRENGCIEWTRTVGSKGYGIINLGQKKYQSAHRYAYELAHGQISDGLWVLHKCDNRKCVNPDHLFLGTHEDNTSDMVQKGRARGQKLMQKNWEIAAGKTGLPIEEVMAKGIRPCSRCGQIFQQTFKSSCCHACLRPENAERKRQEKARRKPGESQEKAMSADSIEKAMENINYVAGVLNEWSPGDIMSRGQLGDFAHRLYNALDALRALPSAELERDAARYHWIRKRMDLIGTDDFREFDKDVDRAMHNDAVARAKEATR